MLPIVLVASHVVVATIIKDKIMKLKSLAEIAFDAYQCFCDPAYRFPSWDQLTPTDKGMWERIATRVRAEVLLRADGEDDD